MNLNISNKNSSSSVLDETKHSVQIKNDTSISKVAFDLENESKQQNSMTLLEPGQMNSSEVLNQRLDEAKNINSNLTIPVGLQMSVTEPTFLENTKIVEQNQAAGFKLLSEETTVATSTVETTTTSHLEITRESTTSLTEERPIIQPEVHQFETSTLNTIVQELKSSSNLGKVLESVTEENTPRPGSEQIQRTSKN